MRLFKKMIFLFVVCAIAFMTFSLSVSAAGPVSSFAYNITTQFGEDASTEANINFNSNTDKAYVEYTLATDTNFANAIKVEGDKKQFGDDFKEDFDGDNIADTRYQTITDYNYEVYLKDLQPGTQYMYRVTDGSQKSDVFKFTTATGDNTSYTFAYIADPQLYSESGANAYYECLDLAQAKAKENGTPIQFVMGGGDMVESGGDAYYWNKLLSYDFYKEVQYMAISGNHEFTGLQSYLGKDGRFYSVSVNNPKNGCESYGEYQEVSCFYKYNDTLFIQLSSSGKQRKDQVAWVDKVLSENPAQFVIVVIHYPVVSTATDNAQEFIEVFDKYGVDLVLYGHTHTFAIQEKYYNWKPTSEEGKGTYYQSQASSERSGTNEGIYALITVGNDFIQVKNYNRKGAQLQSFSVKAKRTQSSKLGEFDKETFKQSINITSDFNDSTKAILSWDKTGYTNVKYINLKDQAGNVISSNFIYCDIISQTELKGFEANKEYNYLLEVIYNDGSTEEIPYTFNTNVVYGVLENLEVSTTSSRFRLMYTPKFKGDVQSLKVFVNDNEVATAKVKDTRILISLDEMVEGIVNKIEVKGVLADGSLVPIYETTYGEDKSAELNEKKEAAKKELEDYVASLDLTIYADETVELLNAEKVKVAGEIDNAADEAAIAELVAAFKAYVEALPLKGLAEELKVKAKADVDALLAKVNEADYTAEEWALVVQTKEAVYAAIDEATTEEELAECILVIESLIDSLVEIKNAELQLAKDLALVEVENKVAELKEEDYTKENWALINEKKADALANIAACESVEAIEELLNAFVAEIDAIEKVEAIKEYTVKFVADGKATDVKVAEGEKASKPADPVKEGYKFLGWYVGDTLYDFEDAVNGDLELTAKFEEVQEEQPGEPEAPSDKSEEKSGCGNAASILFLSFALLGLCIIKKKQ